jgi:uncharacterized membrane protein YdjX (TVP38/TMEM64 family)
MTDWREWLARWPWRRLALLIALAIPLLVFFVWLGREIETHGHVLETWVADLGPWGMLVLAVLLIAATSLLVPESVFGVAAGALYGMAWGFALLLAANVLAAVLQYTLAKRWLTPRIQRALSTRPAMAAIQRAVVRDEIRLQLLLRLAPLNPAAISYLLGAAGVRLGPFLFACLALTPHLLLEVYLGEAGVHLARMAADGGSSTGFDDALLVGGLVAGVLAVVVISRIAYRAVLRTSAQTPSNHQDDIP